MPAELTVKTFPLHIAQLQQHHGGNCKTKQQKKPRLLFCCGRKPGVRENNSHDWQNREQNAAQTERKQKINLLGKSLTNALSPLWRHNNLEASLHTSSRIGPSFSADAGESSISCNIHSIS